MIGQDIRYAFRQLARSPGFTGAVVLTIALGIGANTAIFTVVNAVMLKPLPFAAPDRLMQVAERNDKLHLPVFGASVLNYLSWKEQATSFEGLAAIGFATLNLSGKGEPEQFTGASMSPSLLSVLGLKPVAGRGFREGEDKPGAAPVVMISEGLLKRRFGADPALVGGTLTLNGVSRTVVGIAPAALAVMTGGDMWIPLTIDPANERRLNHVIRVVGRLKDGVSVDQAQAEMDTVAARVAAQFPEITDWGIRLVTFFDWFVSAQLRTTLLVLLGAVACVLLIACANVANLLLARAASRQKEIAVRTAMGASRSRLLRQFLVESLVLSGLGGGAGLLLAVGAVSLINGTVAPSVLPIPEVRVDATVLLFALGATVLTGLLFGIVPAWSLATSDIHMLLKQSAAAATGGGRARVRNALAGAELALATVLLIGAGLLVQSLVQLRHVALGFEPDHLLTFQLSLPTARYPAQANSTAFYRDLVTSLEALPGVKGAAVSSGVPFGSGNYTTTPVVPLGKTALPRETAVPVDWRLVSSGFWKTMQIPLLRGRTFTDADGPDGPFVMIVSRATAEKFWGSEDPIGRTVRRVGDKKDFTVVGVVGDVRNVVLSQEAPAMYFPASSRVAGVMDVVVRTGGPPESALAIIRDRVHQLDTDLPVATVSSMDELLAASAAQPRLNAVLLALFAGVAVLVAAIGIYGVLAYSVTQRTREIGLRMALGAQPRGVVRLIVREGMSVGLTGIGVGLVAALGLSSLLTSLVFGVPVRDPATFAAVSVLLAVVALAACTLPAQRASRVDPLVALREE
ncbi:MAG: ABC transporter permease [Acidobacteria bacterium]|nr:ABC transporter permease [Acidobacteriota bacterium]